MSNVLPRNNISTEFENKCQSVWVSKLLTYILFKKYKHGLPLLLHSMVNNISNHYANDQWSPIYIAEIVGFTVEVGQRKQQKMSLL